MQTDADVIRSLQRKLSEADLAQTLHHILRIKEVWEFIHEPQSLERLDDLTGSRVLTPGEIALRVSLDANWGIKLSDLKPNRIALGEWPSLIQHNVDIDTMIESAVGVAAELSHLLSTETDPDELITAWHADPASWRLPGAIAWPLMPDPVRFFTELMLTASAGHVQVILDILLANLTTESAVTELSRYPAEQLLNVISRADEGSDVEFWRQLSNVVLDELAVGSNPLGSIASSDPSALNQLAIALRMSGRSEQAADVLSTAWKAAAENTACIADELAKVTEDPVLTSEAAQQAFNAAPSPLRKAHLARSLSASGRREEAWNLLLDGTSTPAEQAASGLIHLDVGEVEQARSNLKQAAEQFIQDENDPLEMGVLEPTIEGLSEIGEPELAFNLLQCLMDAKPADAGIRVTATHLLQAMGDSRQASAQARIAAALKPNSIANKTLAAETAQAEGDYTTALEYWGDVVTQDVAYQRQYAEAAYLSGDHALAIEIAESMIARDPQSVDGIVLLGHALAHSGDYAKAKSYLERAVDLRPDDPETWIGLGRCLQATGDIDLATETISKGIAQSPNHAELFAARSSLYAARGDYSKALEDAAQASEIEPAVAEWAVDHADILHHMGRDEEAIPRYETALKLLPAHASARSDLALCLEKTGDIRSAAIHAAELPANASPDSKFEMGRILTLAALQGESDERSTACQLLVQAAEEGNEAPTLPYWIGQAYDLVGDHEAAFLAFQECLDVRADIPDELQLPLSEGFARSAIATGKAVEALTELENTQRFHPSSGSLYVLLSEAKLAMGSSDEALKDALQAIEFEPSSVDALKALSKASVASGSIEDAINAYQRMVEIDPDQPGLWMELGRLSIEVGDAEGAKSALAHGLIVGREDAASLEIGAEISTLLDRPRMTERLLNRSIAMNPDNPSPTRKLAEFYEAQDDQEQANHIWLELLEREPQQTDTLNRAAHSMARLGRNEAAIGLWQRALNLEPENASLQMSLAQGYLNTDKIEKGLDHFRIAFELEPENPALGLEFGKATLKYADPEVALEILQKALELQPDDPEARFVLAECLLQCGRPKDVITLLENRQRNASTDAILSIAHFELAELAMATKAFQDASRSEPASQNDVIWLSRAAMAIGQWQAALEVFHDIEPTDMEPIVLEQYLRTVLRQNDLDWLLGSAFGAIGHAPPSESLAAEIDRAEAAMHASHDTPGYPQIPLEKFELWRSIGSGEVSAEEVHVEQLEDTCISQELSQSTVMALLRGNRPAKAEALLQSDPDNVRIDGWDTILLGLCRLMLNQYEEARTALHIAARNPFLAPICTFLIGRSWSKVERYDLAIENFNEALVQWTDEPAWNYELAECYIEMSMDETALPHLQKSVDSDPQNFQYLVAFARTLKTNGQISDAEEYYRRALRALPKSAGVWKEAAEVALANGHSEQAEEWFERAATLAPSDPHCLVGSAKAAFALGKKREAVDRAQAAMRIAPQDAKVLSGMAEILESEGKTDEALKLYQRALNTEDAPGEVRITRSKLLVATGRSTEAIEELKLALNEMPENHQAWAALGMAHEMLDAYSEAAEAYRQARDLSPRNPDYLLAIGRIARKSGQLDHALDELTRAETQFPTDASIAYELGQVHEERRELQKALDAYRRSLTIHPEQPEAHRRAGLLLKELKAYREAEEMLERAAELDPRDPNVLHQLAAVRALLLVHGGIPESAVTS